MSATIIVKTMGQLTEAQLDCVTEGDNEHVKNTSKSLESKTVEDLNSFKIFDFIQRRLITKLSSIIVQLESEDHKHVSSLLDTFGFYKLCSAIFINMNWSPTINQEFTLNEFINTNQLLKTHSKLILTLLRRLAERDILEEKIKGKVFKVIQVPPSHESIREEMKKYHTVMMEKSNWVQEVATVDYFGSHLYTVLSGNESILKILFPYEKDTLNYPYGAKKIYENSYCIKQAQIIPTITGVQEHINFLNLNNNHGEIIRILEIGAGTGGTTIPLLKALPLELFTNLKYTFTDISNLFTVQTKSIIEVNFPKEVINSLEFKTLDIELEPKEHGFEEGSYDIIIATNVFHATEFLNDTLTHTRNLIKSNGLLVLGELFQSNLLLEMSFALTNGWWRFGDDARVHSSPLLTETEWKHLLKAHGFENSFIVGDGTYGTIFAVASSNE